MTKDLFPNFVNVSPQTHQREQWRDKLTKSGKNNFPITKKVPGIRLDTGDPHLKRRLPTLPLAQYHRRCEA